VRAGQHDALQQKLETIKKKKQHLFLGIDAPTTYATRWYN
jgi:hypothetical protein